MFIARWHVEAKFGHKNRVIELLREWQDKVGAQAGMGSDRSRMITGSIGAREAVIEIDMEVETLAELEDALAQISEIEMHEAWGVEMQEFVVSGSSYWEIFRLVD